jgi:hypothetical protein
MNQSAKPDQISEKMQRTDSVIKTRSSATNDTNYQDLHPTRPQSQSSQIQGDIPRKTALNVILYYHGTL